MKNILINSIKLLTAFIGFAFILVSCEYKDVADADYTVQKLYMPTAVNGIFTIDNVPQRNEYLPTPGQAYRFTIDQAKNKLIIPLGVYRSGIDRKGQVTAEIASNTDTIIKLIEVSKISAFTTILPEAKFTIPASVDVADGSEIGTFNMEIDLDYLRSFPDVVFGIGIGISSSMIEVNPLYNTTIIVINTKILNPVANFSANIDANNKLKVTFLNTSTYTMKNSWNFGDGTTVSTETSPSHTYANAGDYTVVLTATGVTGATTTKSVTVTIL